MQHLPSPAPTPDHSVVPPPAVPSGPPDQADIRARVEDALLKLSQDLFEMEICAGDVSEGMESAVPRLLGEINKTLAELDALSAQMTDSVPHQVIENIDRNRNPHGYTKMTLSRATGENQYALGRVLGLESFRRQLHDALSTGFPDVPLPERRHHPIRPEAGVDVALSSQEQHEPSKGDGMANGTPGP